MRSLGHYPITQLVKDSRRNVFTLFNGDVAKVQALDQSLSAHFGFSSTLRICGQTYSRKVDTDILFALSSFAASVHKCATDIRLLANLKELEEPYSSSQIGSSAMAYKRNPMRCERACALARHLMNQSLNGVHTHALQWLERSLDDSANRRLSLSEGFLVADALCRIMHNVCDGLIVYPAVIEARLKSELPFMATENIIMAMVQKGADRQEVHERIRKLSWEATKIIKEQGGHNDLLERIHREAFFEPIHEQLSSIVDVHSFIGLAPIQVQDFLQHELRPALQGCVLQESQDLEI